MGSGPTTVTRTRGTGKRVWSVLTGVGLGYNNNYAPITLGPDGTAYIGVLGGLVAVRDSP